MYTWYDMIQKMKNWVDENMEDDPSLSDIAQRLGYSYHYTAKKFHEIEGISFREYILKCKIQKAAGVLYATNERMIDVALKYGYSSQEAFTRAFVKVYGVTPAIYRRLQKPTLLAEKSALLRMDNRAKPNQIKGGNGMNLYVKQMCDWNCYAYCAEDVEEQYWDYFKDELWWQLGNGFIKTYDNVKDFQYCAENFTKYGEMSINQHLKILPVPWEAALDLLIPEMKKTGVDWYIHGSAAMALWGIDVKPRDVNIIIPNYSDYDIVRDHFYKLAIRPFERCENWVASGLGTIFLKANIGFAFHNKELEPYHLRKHHKLSYKGEEIYVSTLEMLKQDNEYFGRAERAAQIADCINSYGVSQT